MLGNQELPCPEDDNSINEYVEIDCRRTGIDKIRNEDIHIRVGVAPIVTTRMVILCLNPVLLFDAFVICVCDFLTCGGC